MHGMRWNLSWEFEQELALGLGEQKNRKRMETGTHAIFPFFFILLKAL